MANPLAMGERWGHGISRMTRRSLRHLVLLFSRPPTYRSPHLRSVHWLGIACLTALTDSPTAQVRLNYNTGPDPWGYAWRPQEAERYAAALGMLEKAAGPHGVRVVDVGCGEGFFTKSLARRYPYVLGLDASSLALERAAERCAEMTNVKFREWDLRRDDPPGEFDVVVCMDVIEYVARPFEKRAAVTKVARMVVPGGRLLVTASLGDPVVERSRWGRLMLWGGHHVVDRFGRTDPNLVRRRTLVTAEHVVALYERI